MRATIAVLSAVLAACALAQDRSWSGPFTEREAELMSTVWPEIREAAAFDDIDWRAEGLSGPPGDAEARRLMSAHWDALRRAADFRDIDWEATTDYDDSERDLFGRGDAVVTNPFSPEETALLSAVWPEIRRAEAFSEIDWEAVGLEVAPGDARARSTMADHWGALRQAAEFDDIDWAATVGRRGG